MYYDGNWIRSLDCTAGLQGGFSDAFRYDLAVSHNICMLVSTALVVLTYLLGEGAFIVCRQDWQDKITLCGGLNLREVHTAADGTRKMVFNLLVRPL